MVWWALGADLGRTPAAAVAAQDGQRFEELAVAAGPGLVLDQQGAPSADALAARLRPIVTEGQRRFGGADPAELVMTHPAGWGLAEQRILRLAAVQVVPGAVITLIAEPVAAAAQFAAEQFDPEPSVAGSDPHLAVARGAARLALQRAGRTRPAQPIGGAGHAFGQTAPFTGQPSTQPLSTAPNAEPSYAQQSYTGQPYAGQPYAVLLTPPPLPDPRRRRQRLLIGAASVSVVLLVAAAGVLNSQGRLWPLLGRASSGTDTAAAGAADRGGGRPADAPAGPGSGSSPATGNPSAAGDSGSGDAPVGGSPAELAGSAQVSAGSTAPDGQDAAGDPISYQAANVSDGDATTTWRSAGDGSGVRLRFSLGTEKTITSVGLINGYPKLDPVSGADRYTQERRITAVTWILGDGTSVHQDLADGERSVQTLQITPVQATTIELSIESTTAPGDPARDYTAISEVQILGQ